uniref:LAGLIDADG homing endonuclease n=1 Tax=Elmerina hispida TaxID=1245649 RepID=UPI003003715D|nr:LAGLIDADG homing endonuclease [Elmerina hispida]
MEYDLLFDLNIFQRSTAVQFSVCTLTLSNLNLLGCLFQPRTVTFILNKGNMERGARAINLKIFKKYSTLFTFPSDNRSNILMEKFIGVVDGDGYIEIGPQKQYNKNTNNSPKSTIRMRIVIRLHKDDKGLLEIFINEFNLGKLDELKSVNQYRLNIYKDDILKTIYPYLNSNNIEFLTYNRRKQYFLLKYILENNITHWDDLNLEDIFELFNKTNREYSFKDILNLPYFKN